MQFGTCTHLLEKMPQTTQDPTIVYIYALHMLMYFVIGHKINQNPYLSLSIGQMIGPRWV